MRNRLIALDPCEDVKTQERRRRVPDQVVERVVFRSRLLPAIPDRHLGIVAVAGGRGLRWVRQPAGAPTRSISTAAGCA